MLSTDIGLWIQAFIMVAYLSAVLKDNIFCRIAMQTVVGAGVGHWVLSSLLPIYKNVIIPLTLGQLEAVILAVLGIMVLLRLSSKHGWVAKYPNSILFGVGAGITGASAISSQIVGQIKASLVDFPSLFSSPADLIGNIILIVSMLSMLSYFLFTIQVRGPGKTVFSASQKFGRYFLMFLFGGAYTNTWCIGALQSVMGLILFNTFGITEPM